MKKISISLFLFSGFVFASGGGYYKPTPPAIKIQPTKPVQTIKATKPVKPKRTVYDYKKQQLKKKKNKQYRSQNRTGNQFRTMNKGGKL